MPTAITASWPVLSKARKKVKCAGPTGAREHWGHCRHCDVPSASEAGSQLPCGCSHGRCIEITACCDVPAGPGNGPRASGFCYKPSDHAAPRIRAGPWPVAAAWASRMPPNERGAASSGRAAGCVCEARRCARRWLPSPAGWPGTGARGHGSRGAAWHFRLRCRWPRVPSAS